MEQLCAEAESTCNWGYRGVSVRDLLEREELASYARFVTPCWEDAAWIGNRLGEILPLPLQIRQSLLEMTEPRQRLDILLAIFQEQRTA